MQLDESIDRALSSPEPIPKLRALVKELFSRGADKASVLAAFENARQELRRAGREADEDAVMDAMDFLVGWCSPHVKLEPEPTEPQANGYSAAPDGGRQIRQTSHAEGESAGEDE